MNRASDDRLREIARRKGVTAAGRHIFLCCDQTTPNCCDRDGSLAAWYHGCHPPVLERIIEEHLIGGRIVQEHLILQHPLTE